MERLARTLRLGAFTLACSLLALAVGLIAIEESGWLASRIRRELSDRLREPVSLADAHLRWFGGTLELEGLGFETPGGGLFVERASCGFGRGPGGIEVRRIEILGGHAVLSQVLVDRLRRLAESDRPATAPSRFPVVVLQELQVDFSDPEWGYVPIGLVDVLALPDDAGKPVIEGRIVPTLAVRATEGDGRVPEIYLGGREVSDGFLEIHGSSEGIPVTVDALPEGTGLEVFREYAPEGELALDAQAYFRLDGTQPPSGTVRAALTRGSIRPSTSEAPFEDVRVEIIARCTPGPEAHLLDPRAWQSTARIEARWKDSPIAGWALFGRNSGRGLTARGWAVARDLPLSREALGGMGIDDRPALRTTWDALALRGTADVVVGVRAPADGGIPEFAVEVLAKGSAGVSYVGWPTREDPDDPQGVPLPVEDVSGQLLIAIDPRREVPMLLGFLDVSGSHSGGERPTQRAHADGLVIAPPPGERGALFDLRYGGEDLAANDDLRVALEGLNGTDFIFPMFSPAGGSSSFEAHMIRKAGMPHPASRFEFDLRGLSGAFSMLPARVEQIDGELELVFDQELGFGAGFAVEGRSATSERISVAGRVQEDLSIERAPGVDRMLRDVAVEARGVALRGLDRDVVDAAVPAIGQALDLAGAVGKVDVAYRNSTSVAGGAQRQSIEVTPTQVEVSPANFKVRTQRLRGRVLVEVADTPPDNEEGVRETRILTRLQPLVGDWSGNTKVAVVAEQDSEGFARLRLMGSGLDVSNRVLAGAFREAFTPKGSDGGVDLAALAIDGRVDFTGELSFSPMAAGERRLDTGSSYRIHLRDNDLETRTEVRMGLGGLRGTLEQRGNLLYGDSITARLGSTPLKLRGAEFSIEEDGTYQFDTRLEARDLPLDREHMRHFLDGPTLEALVDGLGWRGRVDIDDARLRLSGSPSEPAGRVDFEGHAVTTDMFIDIGLPLSITQASVNIESLVLEGGHVRAWATLEDLDGHIADRKLEDARMTLTYIEPHLSVLDLDGRFEKGRLRNLATEGSSGPAFSIDLEEPFTFGVAIRLVDVDVARLLRGLFESDFAGKGDLSAELRLVGSLDRITSIRGDGLVDLRESTLWSIPVMRNLFSQLGFDNTAVFDEMSSRFRIANGVVYMDEMAVESPLLDLVGQGTLDFDGRLHHDLAVHYGLIDQLGPLTRILYWIQNNLLSVSIRGDMSRPRVVLQGALSFIQRLKSDGRELPLPGFSPLSEHF